MVRTAWVVGALALGVPQLACQSPSATPTASQPVKATNPRAQLATAADVHTPLSAEAPRPRNTHALRLATWNMQWLAAAEGRGPVPRTSAHYDQLAHMAGRLNADVIAVQEVESPQALARVFNPQQYLAFISDSQGSQDVGFVVRRGIQAEQLPDVLGLNVGGVRPGADLLITVHSQQLRLLSVHLKSGCFHGPLKRSKACSKLAAQVAPLEEWIDAREREGIAYAVLGDFNRKFYSSPQDAVWSQLNDADPVGLQLWSPTSQARSQCWDSRHPDFVDHLVLGRKLHQLASVSSFQELLYPSHAQPKYLSDHCPLSLDLELTLEDLPPGAIPAPSAISPTPSAISVPQQELSPADTPAPHGEPPPSSGPIKGNISSRGKKLYHLPTCPSYAGTKIDPAQGERWFPTELEAQSAGWAKSPNCP